MPCVHYKFRSKLTHDTVEFEGLHITLTELKRQIMRRERLKLCDLQISSAQTNEEYTDDEALIPNNTSVIIRRIPVVGLKSTNRRFVNNQPEPSCGSSQTVCKKGFALAFMFNNSLWKVFDQNDKSFAPRKRMRKCAGIPRSFLVEVDDPDRKGVMMDSSGKYVIPIMNAEAYVIGKKEKPPFSPQNEPSSSSSSDPVPAALLCLICKDLLTDAVMIPCCSTSYCDECIRTCLLESDGHLCPTCRQSDVSPDALTANTVLRQEVNHFRNGTRSLRPNHSRRSRSPIPESSSKRRRDVRENRSHSRSPLNRYTDQKRLHY
ncbi:E3 ubiquitin-protein ligase RBBP6-like [Sinocyclocheilus rhinocerous]|uniref:E3 ubiquitin-protein ligase RBBP6-like n=1 Tax=Sinocyclocheilus rhinocerous TaxID=307959 RepID=UPI0007BADC7B|nr:PREDICTED: E3 ubiquitin-protein ligase RBBP6-like [Sinocyclocheilus rhinocerous]